MTPAFKGVRKLPQWFSITQRFARDPFVEAADECGISLLEELVSAGSKRTVCGHAFEHGALNGRWLNPATGELEPIVP